MVMLHEGHVELEGSPEEFRNSTNPVVRRFLRGEASEEELKAIRAVGSEESGFTGSGESV
jgi:ABC-type transporter Mla maintaining outer membrane lipid asymmetry ATPase subunit MlaF